MRKLAGYWKYYITRNLTFLAQALWYFLNNPLHLRYYLHWRSDRSRVSIPWLTFNAVEWLQGVTSMGGFKVVEWGMGSSTNFFRDHSAYLLSFERNLEWYKLFPEPLDMPWRSKLITEVTGHLNEYSDQYFDIALIDDIDRNECIREVMSKMRKGGYVILDNSDRPEYEEGIALFKDYKRIDFWGPGLFNRYFWMTSVFIVGS